MVQPRFDLGLTSKTLNLPLLRFNERSGFENLAETEASWEIFGMQIFVKWWLLNKGSIFAVEQCSNTKDNRTKMLGAGGRDVTIRGDPT